MLNAIRASTPWRVSLPRWGICAGLAILLLALGQLVLLAADTPPVLGIRATAYGTGAAVEWVQPAGAAWDAGIRPGDTIVAVDGRAIGAAEAVTVMEARQIVAIRRDGATVTATTGMAPDTTARRQGAFLLLATWFALVGGVTFILAHDSAAALALLTGTVGAAAALLTSLATPYGAAWSLATVFVALNLFGLGTFLFFLRFPVDRSHTGGGRVALLLAVATHGALIVSYPFIVRSSTVGHGCFGS